MDQPRVDRSREMGSADANAPSTHPTHSTGPTIWGVAEYYYPNFSGAAIQAHRILSRLAGSGTRVKMLTLADQAAAKQAGCTRWIDGVEVHYLPVIRKRDWSTNTERFTSVRRMGASLNQTLRDYSFQRAIVRTLERDARAGDVIQLYVVSDWTWLVLRAARKLRLRVIIQISLIGADDPQSFRRTWLGISTWLKRRCFFHVERIIGLSRALTDSCHSVGLPKHRVMRIPNGVDLETFPCQDMESRRAGCVQLGCDPQRLRIVFVGSAILRKGIDVAIRAFRQLAKELDHVDLLVVGPSDFSDRTRHEPQREACLQNLRDELQQDQLTARVTWVGQVENVADYLLVSDLFFFPTRREGLPNALAEAMACGLPVVASQLDGITTDLVNNGQEGFLIPGHEPKDYVPALVRLCQDQELRHRMGRAARQRIEGEFELKKVVSQYAAIYHDPPAGP